MQHDVTIRGEPGEMLLADSDVPVCPAPGVTVWAADLDQAALLGLPSRVVDLGSELVGVQLVARAGHPPERARR